MNTLIVTAGLLALSANASGDEASDWTAWRGPLGHGSAEKGTYPAKFGPSENVAWKVALPGKGCSTPVVAGRRIILTGPEDGRDTVFCFDLDGKPLWKTDVGVATKGKHRNGSAANSSPATDGRTVAAYFKSGTLAGLDLESGERLWSTNLQEKYGKYKLYWDQGTSPVLTKEHVVVAVLHGGDSYLAAFGKRTGELAWKVERNYETPVENDHSYATPVVYERDGRERLLVWGAERLTAHDAADGTKLWECGGFNPGGQKNWVTVGSAVVVDSMAVFSYGRGRRTHGVKLGGSGDVSKSHRAWDRDRLGAFVPTPAVSGGRVYLLGDQGQVSCVDPATGETAWEGRLPKGKAKYYASPTLAGGRLYAPREDGVVMVASVAGGKLGLLAENDMGERIIASPVPLGGRLLLRGEKHLFCLAAK